MYKTKLQELCHQFAWNLPEYATEKEGPDHNPRFTATVIVNGVSFESPKDQCRSSKEAQNVAAHIAFDHFTVPKSDNLPSPAVSSPSGASTSNNKVDVRPPNVDIFQQRQNNMGQLSRVNGTPLAGVDANTSKGWLVLGRQTNSNPIKNCSTDHASPIRFCIWSFLQNIVAGFYSELVLLVPFP